MKDDNPKIVYLDANFLVDWFIRKQPTLKKRARVLLARLLAQFDTLAFSPLTVDESWKGIKEEIDSERVYPYSKDLIFAKLENFTEKVLTHSKTEIVQLQDPHEGVRYALNFLKQFSLEPRDAFHLAIMKDNGIIFMVTRDNKFIKKQSQMEIKIVKI